MLKNLS